MNESCGSCKFFAEQACRRYPPQIFVIQGAVQQPRVSGLLAAPAAHIQVNVNATWPRMEVEQWCGEYQAAKSKLRLAD